MDNLPKVAHAILTLAAAGTAVPEVLVDALAKLVLENAVVVKAMEVQAGGPHKLLRAVELAEVVGEMVMGEAGGRAGLAGSALHCTRVHPACAG